MMEISAPPYHNVIMDRFRNQLFAGRPKHFDIEAQAENPICGDRIHVYFAGAKSAVSHESQGCAIMIASAELMAEAVSGKNPAQIQKLRADFETVVTTGKKNPNLGALNALADLFEYPSRIRCATLPWTTLGLALEGAK